MAPCQQIWLWTTFFVKQCVGAVYLIFLVLFFMIGLVTVVPVVCLGQLVFSLCVQVFANSTNYHHHSPSTKNLATATLTTSPPTHFKAIQFHPQVKQSKSQRRVAIVGAGWTGVHLAKLLVERGMLVEVFEKLDDIGGTWHPSNSYKGLHLHSATWSNEFPDFPYPDKSRRNTKLSAEEMLTYMRAFAETNDVLSHVRFNTTVTHIKYQSSSNTGSVTLCDNTTGQVWEQGDYDLVVIATFCTTPKIPKFHGSENFSGRVVHSSALQSDWLEKQLGEGAAQTCLLPARRPPSFSLPTTGAAIERPKSSTLQPHEVFARSDDHLVLPLNVKSDLDSARTVSSLGSVNPFWKSLPSTHTPAELLALPNIDLDQHTPSTSPKNSPNPSPPPSPARSNVPSVTVQGSPPPLAPVLSKPQGSVTTPLPSPLPPPDRRPTNIVVLGASKSATDMLQLMSRTQGTQSANVVWLHRRCYHFFKYECFSHTRAAFGMFRGFCVVLGMPLVLLAPWMYCLFNLLCGAFVRPVNFHLDFRRFHFGVLDREQAELLRRFPRVQGEVEMLTPTGIRLNDGRHIEADIIVCATGYTTGVPQIQVERDGKQIDLLKQTALFHHMFVPEVPILAITVTSLVSFGPIRAVTLAQHIDWYLSRRNPGRNSKLPPLTSETMRCVANRNLLKQSVNESLLFSSFEPMLAAALKYHLDLVRVGIVRPWQIVLYMMWLFVLNRQRAVQLCVGNKSKATVMPTVQLPDFKPTLATANEIQVV